MNLWTSSVTNAIFFHRRKNWHNDCWFKHFDLDFAELERLNRVLRCFYPCEVRLTPQTNETGDHTFKNFVTLTLEAYKINIKYKEEKTRRYNEKNVKENKKRVKLHLMKFSFWESLSSRFLGIFKTACILH